MPPAVRSCWKSPTGVSPNGRASRTAVPRPTSPVVRIRTRAPGRGLVAEPALRSQRAPDGHDRDQRDQDAQLRLDDRRDHRPDGGALRPVAPQLAQAEQHEHDAERVHLAPDDAVEPADRVHDGHERRGEGEPLAAAELADHRPGEPADREVRDDRRDLDQLDADAADEPGRRSPRATARTCSPGCSRGGSRGRRSPSGPWAASSPAQNRKAPRSL